MKTKYTFNPNMYKLVAKNIKYFCLQKKMTLEDLSKYADISLDYLEKLENTDKNLSISIYDLYKISIVLDANISSFFHE